MRPPPPSPMAPGEALLIEIGEASLNGVVVSAVAAQHNRQVVAATPAAEVLQASPDLSLPVRVWVLRGETKVRVFGLTGAVVEFTQHDPETWRLRISELGIFGNLLLGGFGSRQVSQAELLWVLARDAGFPPRRLDFPTLRPEAETFLVVIPVEGVQLGSTNVDAGDVQLTPSPTAAKNFIGLGPADLQAQFVGTGVWAVAEVTATLMWDAEHEAVARFTRALGRLTLAARYSMAVGADGTLRPFDTASRADQPRLRAISGVVGRKSHRMWLRGYRQTSVKVPVTASVLSGLVDAISFPDDGIDSAIQAWLRAADEDDSSVAAVALAEALEFYSAGSRVPHLLTSTEIGMIRQASMHAIGLPTKKADARPVKAAGRPRHSPKDKDRAERIKTKVGDLNTPPAAALLRDALASDGAQCSEKEFDLILKIRGVRRSVLHGQGRPPLDASDLKNGLSLVNRLLMARLRRLASE